MNERHVASANIIAKERQAGDNIVENANIIISKILPLNSSVSPIPCLIISLRQVDDQIKDGKNDSK